MAPAGSATAAMVCNVVLASLLLAACARAWRSSGTCSVLEPRYGAVGDGIVLDTAAIGRALAHCDEVVLPAGHVFLSGPLNLTSNQVLNVKGTLLASTNVQDYPLVAPVLGYGWSEDTNCFPEYETGHKIIPGKLRHAPVIGAYHATNVSIVGSGTIDGQGQIWWDNCTKCHYPPHNDSAFCEVAGRPKLIEFQFVDGVSVHGSSSAPLHLANSPFWTVTPSYSQNIHIHDLKITAPMDKIGNTDGVNIDSCRNVLVEDLWIANSDDGVCAKSGLQGFGMNLAIPTENVLVRNITCAPGFRGGFAIGSEMSGGIRNVTFRDSVLGGERGLHIKTSIGRGGYIRDVTFENIRAPDISLGVGHDGEPLEPGNLYVPIVSGLRYLNVTGRCGFSCAGLNRSACFGVIIDPVPDHCTPPESPPALPEPHYTCKRTAQSQFGPVTLPWPVCLPLDAPVNNDPAYPNWGPAAGNYASLAECQVACV